MSRGVRPPSLLLARAYALLPSVLGTISSLKTQVAYRTAILDFLAWLQRFSKPFTAPSLNAWQGALGRRGLASSSISQRLSAVRFFALAAKEQGLLSGEETAEMRAIRNPPLGNYKESRWLTADQASRLLGVPDPQTLRGKRDRAMLALLISCGFRRDELVHLTIDHLEQGEHGWVLRYTRGEGRNRVARAVPVPGWVKQLLDFWLRAADITNGVLFRRFRTNGELDRDQTGLSDDVVHNLVRQAGAAIGKPELTPHDLRGTCAQLCRQSGSSVEQIQVLLGHRSIQTTERYLGTKPERGVHSVNDQVGIRIRRSCPS